MNFLPHSTDTTHYVRLAICILYWHRRWCQTDQCFDLLLSINVAFNVMQFISVRRTLVSSFPGTKLLAQHSIRNQWKWNTYPSLSFRCRFSISFFLLLLLLRSLFCIKFDCRILSASYSFPVDMARTQCMRIYRRRSSMQSRIETARATEHRH